MKTKLEELKKKLNLAMGHTFAAYGFFYGRDMEQAKEFTELSKLVFDEMINDIETLIKKATG